ncbi:uncharacterized protein BO72DRAFT_83713 [Aspergillus fijiensis CBS 313.89]|uniref:Uncharacterized protein n=1 Tax=Aspergillus fijiensis CBS 313.89 TaxID=1448319 RepID=A0A8G1RSJ0_9EURO|nr:uncharacterized protein BO72DRAFT_83713 [Aspergillus fijiensis CBS 313.89]RAK78028.1 hypothetical protein BO72DRAFT_83713 [Aspergillus fijiensis CBS 313.89]
MRLSRFAYLPAILQHYEFSIKDKEFRVQRLKTLQTDSFNPKPGWLINSPCATPLHYLHTTATAGTGAETWQTEFEGHPITVHTNTLLAKGHGTGNGNPTFHVTGDATVHISVNVNGSVIPGPKVLRFDLPPDLADPWGFAARFLQHEWRTQRQNHPHTYPPEMLFAGIATCPQRQRARFFYEASPAHHGPPLLWTSRTGQTEFPAPSAADGFSFVRDILTFRMDLLSKQGGAGGGCGGQVGRRSRPGPLRLSGEAERSVSG